MPAESMSSSSSTSKPDDPPPPYKPFDIDVHLNQIIPRPRLHLLPAPIAHILGHRRSSQIQAPLRTSLVILYAFLGAFSGIALTTYIFHVIPPLVPSTSTISPNPIIIASLGATAILEYNTLYSPLAQPRSLLLGQALSATIGILVTKAFQQLPPERFEDLRWLAGALAVSLSSVAMTLTKSIHPPAGATALMAATSPEITELGWWLLALVELGSAVMLLVALVWGNLHTERRFPLFWWTEHDLSLRGNAGDGQQGRDEEEAIRDEAEREKTGLAQAETGITRAETRVLIVPRDFEISDEESAVLERLRERLRANAEARCRSPEMHTKKRRTSVDALHIPREVRERMRRSNSEATHMPREARARPLRAGADALRIPDEVAERLRANAEALHMPPEVRGRD